jgi:hypothetical protein
MRPASFLYFASGRVFFHQNGSEMATRELTALLYCSLEKESHAFAVNAPNAARIEKGVMSRMPSFRKRCFPGVAGWDISTASLSC